MDGPSTNKESIIEKLVHERMKLFEADPDFIELRYLIPKTLDGKESGIDFHVITTDKRYTEKRNDGKAIVLSESDFDEYQQFEYLCEMLAKKYKLHWTTVYDMALGIKNPQVPPRLAQVISVNLDPTVLTPDDFDPKKDYSSYSTFSPPLEVIEIMKRVDQLDRKTKEEIKSYLYSLCRDKHQCHITELHEKVGDSQKIKSEINLDVCLRIPDGFSGEDVSRIYRKLDKKRKDIYASLGKVVQQRRRQSKTLMEAETLELLLHKNQVGILGIVDEQYADTLGQESAKRKVINRRYKGSQLLKKHLQ